jgi:hypothetical protein
MNRVNAAIGARRAGHQVQRRRRAHRFLPQSSSASRFSAGAAGILKIIPGVSSQRSLLFATVSPMASAIPEPQTHQTATRRLQLVRSSSDGPTSL